MNLHDHEALKSTIVIIISILKQRLNWKHFLVLNVDGEVEMRCASRERVMRNWKHVIDIAGIYEKLPIFQIFVVLPEYYIQEIVIDLCIKNPHLR